MNLLTNDLENNGETISKMLVRISILLFQVELVNDREQCEIIGRITQNTCIQ